MHLFFLSVVGRCSFIVLFEGRVLGPTIRLLRVIRLVLLIVVVEVASPQIQLLDLALQSLRQIMLLGALVFRITGFVIRFLNRTLV